MLRIAIDAMGGDFGPKPIIDGIIKALSERTDFEAILVGDSDVLKPLVGDKFNDRIKFIKTNDVIQMHEGATDALKRKDSTIYKAIDLARNGEADAVVSAGHSGATMSLATLRIGRIDGVLRPAIATLMPTSNNSTSLVLDVGANVDCKAEHLFEFAVMGNAYAKCVMNRQSPRVGLLSNGEESSKGNDVSKEAFELLNKMKNFTGNVEGGGR